MKKLIWAVEFMLFLLILTQISELSTYTVREGGPAVYRNPVVSIENLNKESGSKDTGEFSVYDEDGALDVYKLSEQINDIDVLQDMAEQEAKRIMETGDVTKLRQEIDKNRPALRLIGVNM